MLIFGKPNEFEIKYFPLLDQYKDDPILIQNPKDYVLGGTVQFVVNGINIFAFDDPEYPEATYSFWDLTYLVEFFCTNLIYHIIDDPFPQETKSKIGVEMMKESSLVEGEDNDITKYLDVDWDNLDMELRGRIHEWNCRHGFISNNGGTLLPYAYFQKIDDKIEVSWKETSYKVQSGDTVCFLNKNGVEYIDLHLYKETVINFCLEFLKRLEKEYPKNAREHALNLQKAIDLKLE